MAKFPIKVPFWGMDNMVTSLRVTVENTDTGEKEHLALVTIMQLIRDYPYRTSDGKKRIDVRLKKWSAKGHSKLLSQTIEYRLSKVDELPVSFVESKSREEDFPASMTFNSIFDIFVGGEKVVSEVTGTAHASRLVKIPPDGDDLFTVNKDIKFRNFNLVTVDCASRFAITRWQKFLIRLGRIFGIVPEYYSSYLQ